MVAGWWFADGREAQPCIALVTNALHRSGWADQPANEFWIDVGGIDSSHGSVLLVFGQPVRRTDYFVACRRIRRGLTDGAGHKFIMEQMATIALKTARYNPLVGFELNVVSLPKPTREKPGSVSVLHGVPGLMGMRFCSYPSGGTQFGPNVIFGGGAMWGVETGLAPKQQ